MMNLADLLWQISKNTLLSAPFASNLAVDLFFNQIHLKGIKVAVDDFSEVWVYVLLEFMQKHRRSLLCTATVVPLPLYNYHGT